MFLNNKKQRVFFVFFFGNPNGFNYICSKSFNITFMKLSHIEHIGIAVKDLATAIPYYEKVLGLTCYNVEEVKDQPKSSFLSRPIQKDQLVSLLRRKAKAFTTLHLR